MAEPMFHIRFSSRNAHNPQLYTWDKMPCPRLTTCQTTSWMQPNCRTTSCVMNEKTLKVSFWSLFYLEYLQNVRVQTIWPVRPFAFRLECGIGQQRKDLFREIAQVRNPRPHRYHSSSVLLIDLHTRSLVKIEA